MIRRVLAWGLVGLVAWAPAIAQDRGALLSDPSVQKPAAHMPKIGMSEAEARALAAYLASLQ